jgi:hypothetical protein
MMFIGKEHQTFFDSLFNDHGFKSKGVGIPKYHLGCDFYRDSDGTLSWGAHSYVFKMLINFETVFGSKPIEFATPMIEKDHSMIETSYILVAHGIKHCRSLIGALQWLVTLGCTDIHLGVATMSSNFCLPR